MKFSKIVNSNKDNPKLIFFNEKKIENDSNNFWHRKLTLKVRNWQFSITWFRAGVDLPENFSYEKVLFFTQLSYHLMCKLLKKSYMLSNHHCIVGFFQVSLHPNCSSSNCIYSECIIIISSWRKELNKVFKSPLFKGLVYYAVFFIGEISQGQGLPLQFFALTLCLSIHCQSKIWPEALY